MAPAYAADFGDAREVYQALETGPAEMVPAEGSRIDVVFAGEIESPERRRIEAWIADSTRAIEKYFGRFSVARAGLLIVARPGNRIGGGTSWGFGSSAIRLYVGRDATREDFAQDWQLVHEMVHLAMPGLPRRHLWLEEGIATYVEPLARIQAGELDEREMWRDLLRDMPKGLPQEGDEGLDRTHTWARTYWGGALFCFVADIEIHRRTNDRLGLQTALRAINMASGGNTADWTIEQFMAVGDQATQTTTMSDLYRVWSKTPVSPDLDAMFARLGIRSAGENITLDPSAPLAALRQSIVQGPQ